jgi:hypothetical protein
MAFFRTLRQVSNYSITTHQLTTNKPSKTTLLAILLAILLAPIGS